jgi:hypothetical protein
VKFAQEDRNLASPKTKDNKPVAVAVHDFNTDKLPAPDYVTEAMAKLNQEMRAIVTNIPDPQRSSWRTAAAPGRSKACPILGYRNPLVWMAEVNGYLVDPRTMPREVQEIAFEKGLVPYIPWRRSPSIAAEAACPPP